MPRTPFRARLIATVVALAATLLAVADDIDDATADPPEPEFVLIDEGPEDTYANQITPSVTADGSEVTFGRHVESFGGQPSEGLVSKLSAYDTATGVVTDLQDEDGFVPQTWSQQFFPTQLVASADGSDVVPGFD